MADNPYFKAFNKHYQNLTIALPAKVIYSMFLKHKLLCDHQLDQEFKAASTDEAKTRLLLDSMRGGLQIGVVNVFQQFLTAITEYADTNNNIVVTKLVEDINKDLPSDLPPPSENQSSNDSTDEEQIDTKRGRKKTKYKKKVRKLRRRSVSSKSDESSDELVPSVRGQKKSKSKKRVAKKRRRSVDPDSEPVVDWLGDFLKQRYSSMRLKKHKEENDSWPPVKTKSYVTLGLMYQKDLQTKRQTIDMIHLRTKGDISSIPKKLDCQQLTSIAQIFSCQSGSILIEGHPGIGKTTLAKEICIQWAEGKLLADDKLVLLLLLRNPDVQKITNIQQLIEHFTKSTSKITQLHSYLEDTHGADVTLIIDGFDELSNVLRRESFFKELLEKQHIPKARIVVTSRPFASASLHAIMDRRIEILGFDHTSRKQYVDEALRDSPSKLDKLQKHFHLYPNIDAICYIPLLMSIIVYLCICQPDNLPPTATKMYQSFIIHTICHFLKRTGKIVEDKHINKIECLPHSIQQALQHLEKLAFNGLVEDKIVFTIDEVHDICNEDPTCYGLLQSVQFYSPEEIGIATKSFNFLHLGLQEYFAAKYVGNLPESDVYILLKESFLTSDEPDSKCARLSNMWIIYCGLTSGRCNCLRHWIAAPAFREIVTLPLPQSEESILSSGQSASDDKAKTQGTSKMMNSLVQLGSATDQDKYTTLSVSLDILENPLKVFYLFQCFQEAQDGTLCNILSDSFEDGEIDLSGYGRPHELVSLGFFLINSNKKWKSLSLRASQIRDHGIKILHNYLCGNQTSMQEIEKIDLTDNYLTGESSPYIGDIIAQVRPRTLTLHGSSMYNLKAIHAAMDTTATVKELCLSNNRLTSQESPVIRDMMSCLEELDLSNNKLDDDAAVMLSGGIEQTQSLRSLLISQNKIGALGGKAIAEKLAYNATLEILSMAYNDINDSGAIAIAKSIAINSTLKELHISSNRIKTRGSKAIANSLTQHASLKVLDLGMNAIADDGVVSVAENIVSNKTLKELDICGTMMTSIGATAIANSLAQNTSLEKLGIHCNHIGKDGAIALADAITKNTTLIELALYGDDTIDEGSYIKILKSLHCNNTLCILSFDSILHDNDCFNHEVEAINSKRRILKTTELYFNSVCWAPRRKSSLQFRFVKAQGGLYRKEYI